MQRLSFWLAVAGVSILAQPAFNILADKIGPKVPAVAILNDYTTRRNG